MAEVEASAPEESIIENEDVQESELGTNKIYMKNKALTITETMGPIQFAIHKVQT
ncbi:hypothetical protein [Exiguobacterium sp. s63]|uniref:hypothetical protein n=1 Tax=Exiguobacterium sp. s63 TaxID=2751274 RepID=UPI00203672AA|nr:hypothetical protein [Exiguobacterium sp. s63]